MHVGEIAVRRYPSVYRLPQRFGGWGFGKAKLHRVGVVAVIVTSRSCRAGSLVPINKAAERPSLVSEAWRSAARFMSADTGR